MIPRNPFKSDPLRAPADVPEGRREQYARLARKVVKKEPGLGREEVRERVRGMMVVEDEMMQQHLR